MNEYTYELIEQQAVVKRTDSDGNIAWIPTDPANTDYAEYLTSLEETKPVK